MCFWNITLHSSFFVVIITSILFSKVLKCGNVSCFLIIIIITRVKKKRSSRQQASMHNMTSESVLKVWLDLPDLAPFYFFLFPKIQSELKGTRFESVQEVKK